MDEDGQGRCSSHLILRRWITLLILPLYRPPPFLLFFFFVLLHLPFAPSPILPPYPATRSSYLPSIFLELYTFPFLFIPLPYIFLVVVVPLLLFLLVIVNDLPPQSFSHPTYERHPLLFMLRCSVIRREEGCRKSSYCYIPFLEFQHNILFLLTY